MALRSPLVKRPLLPSQIEAGAGGVCCVPQSSSGSTRKKMRIAIALGSAAIAVVTLLAVSQSPAQAEFFRTPAGEVKYRWVNPNANNTHLFYYRGYAYPYRSGLAYRERTGELLPSDVPHRQRVTR